MQKIILVIILLSMSMPLLSTDTLPEKRPKIGLVLSGGGAKGLAHIGVLKVLEELEIPIDYITGTSMGAVIGGLYSVGYTPCQLEKIIIKMDWDNVLSDKISRRYVPYLDKHNEGKYLANMPINNMKVSMPKGLITGQNLSMTLSKLTWHVNANENFDNLPIPFRCIACDISTGERIVLDKGFLPEAIRASMAIPTIFTPVEYNDMLLVDGGLVDNLPVDEIIKMGADIIIGVDVTSPFKDKSELKSLIEIIEQTLTVATNPAVKEASKKCDILISPQITDYSSADFKKAESFIARGVEAARRKSPQLRKIAEKCVNYQKRKPISLLNASDSLPINTLEISGLQTISEKVVLRKMKLDFDGNIRLADIEKAIKRLYGAGLFEMIHYQLIPAAEGIKLVLRVKEKNANVFSFGLNYSTQMDAAIHLNFLYRNLLLNGSHLNTEFFISAFPYVKASYTLHTGQKPDLGIGVYAEYNRFDIDYMHSNKKITPLNYRELSLRAELQSVVTHASILALGAEYKVVRSYTDIFLTDMSKDSNDKYGNLYTYFATDTLDRNRFARKGTKLYIRLERIKHIFVDKNAPRYTENDSEIQEDIPHYNRYYFSLEKRLKFSSRLTIISQVRAGYLSGNSFLKEYEFYIGGYNARTINLLPFWGLAYMQVSTNKFLSFATAAQLQFDENYYLEVRTTHLHAYRVNNFLNKRELEVWGYGACIGWESPLGAVSLTAATSTEHPQFIFNLNIGHEF